MSEMAHDLDTVQNSRFFHSEIIMPIKFSSRLFVKIAQQCEPIIPIEPCLELYEREAGSWFQKKKDLPMTLKEFKEN